MRDQNTSTRPVQHCRYLESSSSLQVLCILGGGGHILLQPRPIVVHRFPFFFVRHLAANSGTITEKRLGRLDTHSTSVYSVMESNKKQHSEKNLNKGHTPPTVAIHCYARRLIFNFFYWGFDCRMYVTKKETICWNGECKIVKRQNKMFRTQCLHDVHILHHDFLDFPWWKKKNPHAPLPHAVLHTRVWNISCSSRYYVVVVSFVSVVRFFQWPSPRPPPGLLGCKIFQHFITTYELSISVHVKNYCVYEDKPFLELK